MRLLGLEGLTGRLGLGLGRSLRGYLAVAGDIVLMLGIGFGKDVSLAGCRALGHEIEVVVVVGIGDGAGGFFLKTAPVFECGDERYAWLNLVQAVSYGRASDDVLTYEVFELLDRA